MSDSHSVYMKKSGRENHLLPYDDEKHGYMKTYFEEADQEKIEASELFKEIRSKQVHHFNIIGGGMYPVELCIYLEGEQ